MKTTTTNWMPRLAIGMALLLAATALSNAQMMLIDDFDDGDDVGWTHFDVLPPPPIGPGVFDASSRAYNLTNGGSQPIGTPAHFLAAGWDDASHPQSAHGFIRATVQADTEGSLPWLYMRFSGPVSYVFVANSVTGGFQIERPGPTHPVWRLEDPALDFDLGEQWNIEGGTVGDQISLKVWQVGDEEPTAPQLTITHASHSVGGFGVGGNVAADTLPGFLDVTFDDVYFTPVNCDLNGDQSCGIDDIDSLIMEISSGTNDPNFDLNRDSLVDLADRDAWLAVAGANNLPSGNPYFVADINLDGFVDGTDFIEWNLNKFSDTGKWSLGDVNGDGVTDGQDFIAWNENKFMSADGLANVPEPGAVVLMLVALLFLRLADGEKRRTRSIRHSRFLSFLLLGLVLATPAETFAQTPAGHFANITPVLADSAYLDFDPSVTADGLTMMFTNVAGLGLDARPGSFGSFDLYEATRMSTDMPFGDVENLGPGVNTSGAEESSSLSPDGEQLYFGSIRSGGLGNYDLYQATRGGDGTFGDVLHLGPGISSPRNENNPSISENGETIYYNDREAPLTDQARIWSADRSGDEFTNAQDLGDDLNGPNGSMNRNEPSISSDERFLFLQMDNNATDIWVSTRPTTNDLFGSSLNINDLWPGTEINTDSTEATVNISPDWPASGSKIYFASDRIGLSDIFQATWVTEPCDFNGNGYCDIEDIDLLVENIAIGPADPDTFDLDADGLVNLADRDQWLAAAGAWNLPSGNPYLVADFNLDGFVDGTDFIEWNANKFSDTAKWSLGDANADGVTDGQDFIAWNDNKFMSADGVSAVPEPAAGLLLCLAVMCLGSSRRLPGACAR